MTGPAGEWPRVDLLSHRAGTTPEKTAVIDADRDGAWTYREFDRRVDAAASGLERVASGTVAFLLDTGLEFPTAFFAAMRRASAVAPLNVRETRPELEAKLDRVDPDAIVCGPDTEALAADLGDRIEGPVLSVADPARDGVESLYGADGPEVDPAAIGRDSTQLVMFTSGTTGEPKGVRLTVGNLLSSARASAYRLGVLPEDRWLCCLPMYHMGGLAPVVRSTLYGTTLVVQREFDPGETARVVDERAITGISLVPTMLERMLEAGWRPPESLRFVLLGGAPASRELIERCRAREVPVHPTYGATETASQIATATPAEAFAREGTVGRPLAVTDVAVVDDGGDPVGPGETGELVVSGPTVTPGYLVDERTAAAFDERGLHTGDLGYRDEDGRLWVVDRRDDRIVTGGENVDPGEVREALLAHPSVDDAAVVGLPDEEWGERVAALVVPADPDDPPADDDLLARCGERLAGFKRPRTLGYAPSLPRTASGTVDRGAVRDRLEPSADADGRDRDRLESPTDDRSPDHLEDGS